MSPTGDFTTAWSDPGVVVKRTSIHDPTTDYVAVPRDVLPPGYVLAAAAIADHHARALRVPLPEVFFFALMTPELETPWLERVPPEIRSRYLFRDVDSLAGFAMNEEGLIWINVDRHGDDLIDTVAHEVAHTAGMNEIGAREYGRRARRDEWRE